MSWARRPFELRGPRGRRNLIVAIVAIAVALVALEAVLLVLTAPKPQVTVQGAVVNYVDEGTTSFGAPWFGGYQANYSGSANGYPFGLTAGTDFTLTVVLVNIDSHPHTILLASVGAPFHLVRTAPVLPASMDPEDDAAFTLTLQAPSSAGSYTLQIALTAGS